MKKVCSLAALLLFALPARAHDSVVPHTHSFDHHQSGLFVWSVATFVTLIGLGLVLRFLQKRRHAEPSGSRMRGY